MITPNAFEAGTVLQTSGGGSGISMEVILLVGIAAVVVIALIWMLTQQGAKSSD